MIKQFDKLADRISIKQLTYIALYLTATLIGYIMYVQKYVFHGPNPFN